MGVDINTAPPYDVWTMIHPFRLALVCFLFLSACSFFRKEATVITSHGTAFGERYYSARLVEKLKTVDGPSIKDPAVLKVLKEALTEELVVEGALYSWARANNVSFNSEQLLNHLKLQVGDSAELKGTANDASPTMDLLRDAVYVQLIRGELRSRLTSSVTATDEDLKKFHEEIRKDFDRPKIQLRQIVLAEEHEANTMMQNLREKKISFEDAEKKFSLSRSYKKEDELPWLDPKDSTFLSQFLSASPGLQSKIYQTPAGFHIVYIIHVKKNANQPFAALRPQLEVAYKQKRGEELYLQWLKDQVKTENVSVDQSRLLGLTAEYQESF